MFAVIAAFAAYFNRKDKRLRAMLIMVVMFGLGGARYEWAQIVLVVGHNFTGTGAAIFNQALLFAKAVAHGVVGVMEVATIAVVGLNEAIELVVHVGDCQLRDGGRRS
jgi:hypothetical protein